MAKLGNRIVSLVLAFVMVLGMLPMSSFTAFAADATDTNTTADTTYPYAVVDTAAGTVTIDGTLGGNTTATMDDITALVDAIKGYVDSGITTITVTGSEPALYNFYDVYTPAVSVAIFRLTEDSESSIGSGDPDSPYCGRIDLILQDVTEIVEMEFNISFALNSITLPKVTKLGAQAFALCNYLQTITFGSVVTEGIENGEQVFSSVGSKVDGGLCNLVLSCGQVNAATEYQPDIVTKEWWKTPWKHITVKHTPAENATYTDNGDGTHSFTCSICSNTITEYHSGGEATCTTQAVCVVCGVSYGEVDSDNHTVEPAYTVNELDSTQHDAYYSCCDATVTEDHIGTPVAVDELYHKYEGCCGAVYHTGVEPDGICDVCEFAQYDVWVDAIRITSLNKDDVLNDGGSLKYAPDTYTLTVSGNVTVSDSFNDGTNDYCIYAENGLIITGDADSSLTVGNEITDYGVYVDGETGMLEVTGGMTLNAIGSDAGIQASVVEVKNASVIKASSITAAAKVVSADTTTYYATLSAALEAGGSVYALTDYSEDFTIPDTVTFYGGEYSFGGAVTNNGTIESGTFNGTVTNNNKINGGTFNGRVTNSTDGKIENNVSADAFTLGDNFSITNNGTIECTYHHWKNGKCRLCASECDHTGGEVTYTPNTDGTHSFSCTVCGTGTEDHSGGEATCQKQAVCVLCGTSYGDLNPANHEYENGVCPCGAIAPIEKNANGIYEIYVPEQLVEFAQIVNGTHATIPQDKAANAILKADIDMTGIDWTPICSTGLYYNTTTYTDKGYEGTFDGGGHTISNLKITGTDGVKASYGLFGTLSGTVKNLGMSGMTFSYADTYDTNTTDARAGAIAGQMLDGSLISDCFVVDSSLTPNNYIVGGIAGCNYAGTIQNCYTKNVTISAHSRCGNLVSDTRGDISSTDRPGTVKNCYTDASRVVGTNTSGSEYITGCVANIPDRIFASGRITYQLNGGSDGLWKLNASGLPGFTGDTVYQNTCGGDIFYSTTDGDFDSHNIGTDLRCINCGSYEPATLVTAENYSDLGLDESYVGYYAIKNASNLYWYSERERIGDIGGSIVLLNDITLDNSKAEWVPIGWDGDCTFDGRGNTITLKLDYGTEQDSASYGLFGTCNYCVVKNLFLDGYLTVNTTGNVGAVAASMYRTTISGVISTVNVTNTCTTGGNVGGLAGYFGGKHDTTNNQYSKIENCAVYANVTGYNAGGLVGQGWNGTQYWDITNAAYVGNVTTTNTTNGLAGAIVGYQATDTGTSTFTNIYWCEEDGIGFYGLRDTENQVYTNTSAKTAEQFASGEVAWLLNGSASDGVWKQTLGTDTYPSFTGGTVYYVTNCTGVTDYYNSAGGHSYCANGFCTNTVSTGEVCDAYEPAELVGGVYQITNAGNLYWLADKVNNDNATYGSVNAILTADIVVNENVLNSDGTLNGDGSNFRVWTPIGIINNPYGGTFDGNGKTVSGLYFNNSSSFYVGLIGNLGSRGKVSDVGAIDSYLRGSQIVGGVVGLNAGSMTNCYSANTVKGSNTHIGGVVGGNEGIVTNCYNTGLVSGYSNVGGVVGTNYNATYNATVTNCYNTGSVKCTSVRTGGVVGASEGGTVTNCYYLDTAYDGGIKGEDVDGSAMAACADDFASGMIAYLLQGDQESHVWGQEIGKESYPVLDGMKVYESSDGTYSNTMPGMVARVGTTQYATVQEAVDNANGSFVKLLADSTESVTVEGDLYLDLNGFDLKEITVSGTLYGMDSATDDYDCADGYGTIGTVNGTYAAQHKTGITGKIKQYVAIEEDGLVSFHRIYAAVTHMNLKPASAGFGYKAAFYGDQLVQKYLTSYGFEVWVTEENVQTLTCTAEDFTAGADGNIKTLRIENVLSGAATDATAVQTEVYASVFVTLTVNGQVIQLETDPVSGTLKELLEKVNANTGAYTDEQLTALKTMVETYATALAEAGCEIENLK